MRFRRNSKPTSDSPDLVEFEEEPYQAPERVRGKGRDKRDYTAFFMLRADTSVRENDEVEFDGRWHAFKMFEPIYRMGSRIVAHYEVYI